MHAILNIKNCGWLVMAALTLATGTAQPLVAADAVIANPIIFTCTNNLWKWKSGPKSSISGKFVTPDLVPCLTSRLGRIGIARVEGGTNFSFVPCYPLATKNGKAWAAKIKNVISVKYTAKNGAFSCTVWTQLPPQWALYIDTNEPPRPSMALIPAGSFRMGNCMTNTGFYSWELPVHSVTVSPFYAEVHEVTKQLWDNVYSWAISNGYLFENAGTAKETNHPVYGVSWYDCVKWCNARSEMERLTPCYYTSDKMTKVYRKKMIVIENTWVNWHASGYRLPTDAEWEKAARGGAAGHRFPWSNVDTITHSQANYSSTNSYVYDVNITNGYHPTFAVGIEPFTSPVGWFAANGYGLYDMAGNITEWCWDVFDDDWYENAAAACDPRGPESGSGRVVRGGCWNNTADSLRCSVRFQLNPANAYSAPLGFRCVSGL